MLTKPPVPYDLVRAFSVIVQLHRLIDLRHYCLMRRKIRCLEINQTTLPSNYSRASHTPASQGRFCWHTSHMKTPLIASEIFCTFRRESVHSIVNAIIAGHYCALVSAWNNGKSGALWLVQQLGDLADNVQPCQQPSYWSLAAATCPPIGKLSVVSMKFWGRHMGSHCVIDKIVIYLGPDYPLFHGSVCRNVPDSMAAAAELLIV